jgi:glucose/arabinose dehydrogenase/type 1 glutamine amidotransferase
MAGHDIKHETDKAGEPVRDRGGSGMREIRSGTRRPGRLRAVLACGALALGLLALGGSPALAQSTPKVLVFTGPVQDPTTQPGVAAIEAQGAERGFTVEATGDAAQINADKLETVSAVVFLNTAGDLLDGEQEAALESFVDGGGGFMGIGSAAQSEPDSQFFDGLIGARPSGSSSTATSAQTVVFGDQVHPATRDLDLLQQERTDVWYQWTQRPTGEVHTLARYHAPDAPGGDGTDVGGTDHPISWCRDYRGGRSIYTGMGRTAGSYAEQAFAKHVGGAISWAAGLLRGNCKATIDASYKGKKIVAAGDQSTGLATSGESHGLTIAPNGWVIYIGRGDCRTDQERGNLLGGVPFGRVFSHAQETVGIGCGSVHIYDPDAATGTINSGITRAGTLAVYGDGGQGGERTNQGDHKMEYGLLGVTTAPDFATTGHIYLQYFPSFDPDSKPAGLPVERRISKMSRPRISRFTIDLTTKKLDLDSEVRVFEYDAQIFSCCHVGGGMGFDSAGNLYFTTGDTNSSQGSDGYSGNNPAAKCPTGPAAEPSSAHCGSAHYSYQDARRTAGNTNDYNGKMIRIKPIASLADGSTAAPGAGSTYTIPTAADPNGANLFSGEEGGGGKAKPEIYAMGLRNPSRLSIDPETDIPYTAWVGPDAGAPNAAQGPSTYENAAQIASAGNYGWPYCMGSKQAYRDRIGSATDPDDPAKTTLRDANAPGYVSGGPGGTTAGWYDCDNLRNDSPNNTGLVEFPHQTGTGKDAGTMRPTNIWWSRGNPQNRNGCPEFPREGGAGSAPNYGATPTQRCPYVLNQGLTVMNGPVYRYDGDAADTSRRWPEYWDGRWFVQNSGGASIKHALMLDPATDQNGGQPIYADSLRNSLDWDAAYMDSKFGPDGALYVQVYDGFFRAGPEAGIWRFDYLGGPATPGSAPKAFPIGGNKVSFSKGASGGVSYDWDFGDGSAHSTEPGPTHTYAEAKSYTAKLTVTYADGSKDTGSVTFDVIAAVDDTAPVTTASTSPADPNGTKPVTVTLSATETGGTGVAKTEYRVNGGQWQEYSAPFKRSEPGAYTIEYRSTDRANNVEATKQLQFTISVIQNCTPSLNDEFEGTALSDDWDVLRRDDTALSVADGALSLKVRAGDMFANQATAKNVLLKDAPDGPWVVTTRLDVRGLSDEGQQAGLILWNGESPNTFAKIVFINKGDTRRFEYVATRNGQADIQAGPTFATNPREAYVRVRANGGGLYVPEYSLDGESWAPIAKPIENLGDPDTVRLGLKISDNADADTAVRFLYFRVDCSDRFAPVSKASVDPERPDAEHGWYKSAPTVSLTADDGPKGGVAKIEYSIDGGPRRTYGGPFKIEAPGEHTVTYFATDTAPEPNAEAPNTLSLRVDGAAPETTAALDRSAGADGPVGVTLSAADGPGSGAVLTQYRVDGGPWKTYSAKEEQLFDGSAASLGTWAQAGAGSFRLLQDGSRGIDPVGGLGMLWYPAKQFGDFRLKFQFREGRSDGGFSNGGAFVRFPDPRVPTGQRPDACARTGSAANDQAWVAIYCGHEIQLYDGPTGEPQKTGSIYNFDPNTLDKIGTPKEGWNDYVIEVRGQSYKVFRNGTLINEFENSPGKSSSRGGDPPTSQRQFTSGYVGFQNHGGADRMQYRDVRVEDLASDAPIQNQTGAFQVTGRGPHTIELRSVDAAGNVEPKHPVDFEIGTAAPPSSTGGTPTPTPTPSPLPEGTDDTPATFSLAGVPRRISAKTFAKRGLAAKVRCTGAMQGTARLTVSEKVARKLKLASRTIARRDVRCYGEHSATVRLRASKATRRKLVKGARGSRTVKLLLTTTMVDLGQPAKTVRRTVTVR